jgi:predicted O-linked N-acetylglucosamine transferase (SPINDLY family)
VLAADPGHADALHLLGVLASQRGRHAEGAELIEKAFARRQPDAHGLCNLGGVYGGLGRFDKAEACFRRALALDPGLALAHYNLGNALLRQGRAEAAAPAFERAAALDPGNPDAQVNLGNAYRELGRPDDALACYRRALGLNPTSEAALVNLGNLLQERGDVEGAIAAFERAVRLAPASEEAAMSLVGLLREEGRLADAARHCREAAARNPRSIHAANSLGLILEDQGRQAEAVDAYRRVLALDPAAAGACNNLGNALKDLGRVEEAAAAYRRALDIDPAYADAHRNLGQLLGDAGRLDEAMAHYRHALETVPDHETAAPELLHLCQHVCAWSEVEALAPRVDRLTDAALADGRGPGETAYMNVSRCEDPARNLAVARARGAEIARRAARLGVRFPARERTAGDGRIALGYLSNDFGDHATSYLMAGVFAAHDRRRFRVHAYSHLADDGSEYRKRIEGGFDAFVDIVGLDDAEAARRIHDDGIDILVDLKGHTRGARLEICALRPAPIIVHYLGFPGTTGADFIDYLIADEVVAPERDAGFYAEALVHLPHSYQANDGRRPISDRAFARAECGLPEGGFVFASFNHTFKIEPEMFGVWMSLLSTAPGSVLWLLGSNRMAEDNLRREAAARGIDPGRLVFAARVPHDRHLARLALADLVLDTRVYGGHTTTSDALFAGVPVVAMRGRHFASRVAASLLAAVGLPELVADGLDGYRELARRLAGDAGALVGMRRKLAAKRTCAPLFDTARFVRNLERAYERMWENRLAGRRPSPIDVTEPA